MIKSQVWLLVLPGSFVDTVTPLLLVQGSAPEEAQEKALRAAIIIGRKRNFEQDPRFGIVVLAEIASRALSPAINDPGTAIGVLGRIVRVLSLWHPAEKPEVEFPEVTVPTLSAADLIEDGFRPVARDGAGIIEVQIRLQKALAGLRRIHHDTYHEPTRAIARYALEQAKRAALSDDELKLLKSIAGFS